MDEVNLTTFHEAEYKVVPLANMKPAEYNPRLDLKPGDIAYSGTIDHKMIEADNIFEAMQIADKMFNENVYLLAIMEKTDVIVENEFITYADKLTSRTRGNWHLSDAEHGESPFMSIYHVENDFAVIR